MKTKLIVLTLLLSYNAIAQPTTNTTQQYVIGINAEQMVEKVGFDYLMNMVFDKTKTQFVNTYKANATQTKATMRKAIAAMYGAGIDFSRKIYFTTKIDYGALALKSEENNEPIGIMQIPVANRQVVEKSFSDLVQTNEKTLKANVFKQMGTTSYYTAGGSIVALTDKDMYITNMPFSISYSSYDYYNGKTISTDTIVIPKSKRYTYNVPTTDKKNNTAQPDSVEIDKLINGKVVRNYQPKMNTVGNRNSEVQTNGEDVTTATVAAPTVDSVAMAEIMEAAKEASKNANEDAATPYNKKKGAIDTLTRTQYLNDSIELKIRYVEYTAKQLDSCRIAEEKKTKAKELEFITKFVTNLAQYQTSIINKADWEKINTSKADFAMYSNINYGSFANLYTGAASVKVGDETTAFLSYLTFENGKMTGFTESSCCNKANEYYSKMYLPTSDFFPTEMGESNMAAMRFHINIPQMLGYYNSALVMKDYMNKLLSNVETSIDEVADMISGEFVVNVGVMANEYNTKKQEPFVNMALKLKNTSKAIAFTNKVSNKNDLSSTQYYKYDTNGDFILFSSNKEVTSTTAKKVASKIITNPIKLSAGSYGEMQVNVKQIITEFTKTTKRKDAEMAKVITDFFGNMSIINRKNEVGNFEATFSMDIGNATTNGLYNAIKLGSELYDISEKKNVVTKPAVKKPSSTIKPTVKKAVKK